MRMSPTYIGVARYYNLDNPTEIRTSKEMHYRGVVIIIVGFLIIIVGVTKKQKGIIKRGEEEFNKLDF